MANDFRLQETSPCIHAGIDVGLTRDYVGNPVGMAIVRIRVPVNAPIRKNVFPNAPDIGAYEGISNKNSRG